MGAPVVSSRHREAGLTLIETMVALSLIALMAGVVVAGSGAGSMDRLLDTEANTLAVKLNYAVDEALVGGYPIRLEWSAAGYMFAAVVAAPATPVTLAGPIAARSSLPDRVTLSDDGGGASLLIPPSLDGSPALLVLQAGPERRFVQFDGYQARMLRQEPAQP